MAKGKRAASRQSKASRKPRRKPQTHSMPALAAVSIPRSRSASKKDLVLGMLLKEGGASLAAIVQATGWQPHSVRAFLAKEVRQREKLNLVSERVGGERVYRIAPVSAQSS